VKTITKYSLGAFMALALACSASAAQPDKDKDKDKEKDKDGDGIVYSVPDAGSSLALLGLSVALIVLSQRRIARLSKY
jgi:hypothetical protein